MGDGDGAGHRGRVVADLARRARLVRGADREDHVAPDLVRTPDPRAPLGQLDLPLDGPRLGALPRFAKTRVDAGKDRGGRALLVVQLGSTPVGISSLRRELVAGEPGDQLGRLVVRSATLRRAERQRDGHTIAQRHGPSRTWGRDGLEQR